MTNAPDTVGTRYRLIYRQGGRTHISSVVLGPDEVDEDLAAEADMHALDGWTVTKGDRVIVARSPRGQVRVIEARAFGPLDDLREGAP